MQQMIRKVIPENKDFITTVKNDIVTIINVETSTGNKAEALNYMRFAARDFKDTPFATEIMKMLNDAERSSTYTDAVRGWNRMAASEQDKKEKYLSKITFLLNSSEFSDSTARWWRSETAILIRQRDKGDISSGQMASRLLNFISILCSQQGSALYSNKIYRQASGMFTICTLSNSENPLNYFNLARSEAASGKIKESIDALNGAINHGFKSRKSVEMDPVFEKLKSNDRYKALILRLPPAF
jgi:hypothetical protein